MRVEGEGRGSGDAVRIRRELEEEIRFHIEMRIRELVVAGRTEAEARAEAYRRFGDLGETAAVCVEAGMRSVRRERRRRLLEEFVRDLRLGTRQLWKRPGFAITAMVTLAVGVGANTAIFSAADHVLLRPLPYEDVGRVVTLWEVDRKADGVRREVAAGNFLSWQERTTAFDALGLAEPYGFDLTGPEQRPEPLSAWLVTEGFFAAAGIRPAVGRLFEGSEYQPNGARVAILSHRLWQTRFGGDAGVVGRSVDLDGQAATVVGVLNAGADYPEPADVWAPKAFQPWELALREGGYMQAVARLKPGVTLADARRDGERVSAELAAEFPATNGSLGMDVVPMEEHVLGGVRPALLVLLGAVSLVLLIACANVAGLLLARGGERQRELAVRGALGAGRARLIRQLVAESVVLGVAGGLAGVVLAATALRAVIALSPPDLPRLDSVALDGRVLAFAAGVTVLTTLLFGLVPALQVTRRGMRGALSVGGPLGRRIGAGLRSALVVGEIALALVLLIGAGLLGRSFLRLLDNELGFTVERRATAQLFIWDNNPAVEQREARVREFEERIMAVPGVEASALVSALPFHPQQIDAEDGLVIEGRPLGAAESAPQVYTTVASPEYFRVMGLRLLRGRGFVETDRRDAPLVTVINETLAKRYFPGGDPIGRRVRIGVMSAPAVREIVGIVSDVRPTTFDSDPRPELYVPFLQSGTGSITFVIATRGDPAAVLPQVREAIWDADPRQTIDHTATVEALIRDSLVERKFNLVLLAALALVSLVLATVGVYGLLAFTTTSRGPEIGVRVALGARRAEVTGMIVGDALRLAVPGILLGLAAAAWLTRFLQTLLYGVEPLDPATFAQLALLMLAVASAAAWIPARRAARIDPVRVLRRD